MVERDLFDDLKDKVRCSYISDLRYSPWKEKAQKAVAGMDLSGYSMFMLNDAASYLFDVKTAFTCTEDASAFFRQGRRCG